MKFATTLTWMTAPQLNDCRRPGSARAPGRSLSEMFKRLFRRRESHPVRLPLGYHWERYVGSGPCVCCGQPRPNEWGTIVAWRRPEESDPRGFGPVGACCALQFAPWPDLDIAHDIFSLDCQSCGLVMSYFDVGVNEQNGCPWFDFACDGWSFSDDSVNGCGQRVRMQFQAPTATLFL